MIEREVLQVRRTASGDVVALVNKGASWSPRNVDDAIADIRSGRIRYVVPWSTHRAPVRVADGSPPRLEAATSMAHDGGLALLPGG